MQAKGIATGKVFDRYELLFPVARGGMGQVWAAKLRGEQGFRKLVALKTLLPSDSTDIDMAESLANEAKLASQIRDPHVAETLDFGKAFDLPYLVMEWVDGESLAQVVRRAPLPLPLNIAIGIASQVCKGLAAAHEGRDTRGELLGLVHRDISPQNILLTYGGVAKIVDFGVAKATRRGEAETGGGELKGKFPFMSPEQVRGETLDARTDLFALGVITYMLTTGYYPFKGEVPTDTLLLICSDGEPQKPTELVPGYPKLLERFVMRALKKERSERFQSADEMLRALETAVPPSLRGGAQRDIANLMQHHFAEERTARQRQLAQALMESERPPTPDLQGRHHSSGTSTLRGVAVTSHHALEEIITDNAPGKPARARPLTWPRRIAWLAVPAALASVGTLLAVRLWSPAHAPSATESAHGAAPTSPEGAIEAQDSVQATVQTDSLPPSPQAPNTARADAGQVAPIASVGANQAEAKERPSDANQPPKRPGVGSRGRGSKTSKRAANKAPRTDELKDPY